MRLSSVIVAGVLLWLPIGSSWVLAAMQNERPVVDTLPKLPKEFVDVALVHSTGRTWSVPPGGDVQDTLDQAQLGDEIVLEAGAIYRGPFTLPNKKQGAGWITVRSSAVGRDFPSPGSRVNPLHAAKMPKLVSDRYGVIIAHKGAHHFRFIGIEVRPAEDTFLRDLVMLGNNMDQSIEELPHHIILDRCFVHGDPLKGSRRGLAMNGRSLAVIDSYFSDFKEVGQDSQAIAGWGGSGPFKVVNNFLQGAGENLLFGGGDPKIRDLVPSDIEIRGNHISKPLSWKPGEPEHDGSNWQVKILLELKNARRVVVDGNLFEHNWQHPLPGYGYGITFTVRNEEGGSPWAVIEDVTFTNNIVRHSPNGINIMGFDDRHPPSGQAKRILIQNNLFDDINGPRWGGKGRLFQLLRGTKDVVIAHNTAFQTGHILMAEGDPHEGFVYRFNITPHNEYGMEGAGTGVGIGTLERHFPGAVVTHNVIIGGDPQRYPNGNSFPESVQTVPFVNWSSGDYKLIPSGAASQEIPGVDVKTLCAAIGIAARQENICVWQPPQEPLDKRRTIGMRD